jgi:hypothetical protein
VLWRMAIILKTNQFNLFVFSVLFVFWYHSPNILVIPRTLFIVRPQTLHTHYLRVYLKSNFQ